jgi:RND family efflux transporter MFP subunit
MIRKIIVAGAIMLLSATAGFTAQAQESSVLIQESKVVQQPVSETLTVYGQVQADPDAVLTISLPHAGLITRVSVRLGQRVKRGDSLFELATSPAARMEYLQAQSAVDYAQRELNHQQRLFKEQLAVKAQVDAARKALQDAQANLQALEARKQNKTAETVSAPTDGIVTQLAVKQGDRVQADISALAIATGNRLIALLGVEPEDISLLQPGTPVKISSVFVPDYKVESQLREIHAMINPATHLVDALVPIPADKTDHLVLGSRLTAEIRLNAHTGMTVPRSAVLQDQEGCYVFRIVDGKARRVDVTTGLESDQWIEITGGLQQGDAIVRLGNYELTDGMPVREER